MTRPHPIFALVLLCAAVTLWYGVPRIVDAFADAHERNSETVERRRLSPAYSIGLDPAVLHGAARFIPPNARYAVVVGDTLPLPGVLGEAVDPLLHHWLFPRRHTTLDQAEWVIAYGHPLETLGVQVAREIPVVPGVSVAEIGR